MRDWVERVTQHKAEKILYPTFRAKSAAAAYCLEMFCGLRLIHIQVSQFDKNLCNLMNSLLMDRNQGLCINDENCM